MPDHADPPVSPAAVTQFSVLDALLAGVYESGLAVGEARALGDVGVGCAEGLGGEVILLDGEVFDCTVDAAPRRMGDDERLPFLSVAPLAQNRAHRVDDIDRARLEALVPSRSRSRNHFHAVRVDGVFAGVRLRLPPRPDGRRRPLEEVSREQSEVEIASLSGTLVGFWSPELYQGIAVAGLHLHVLSDDRRVGGHLLDVRAVSGLMRSTAYARFDLRLPTDGGFRGAALTHRGDDRIGRIEGNTR